MASGAQSDPMWPSLIVSVVPIVLGSLATYFKPFVETQAELRSRVRLRRLALLEQLSTKHTVLLKHMRRIIIEELDALRGDGREEPDLVGDLTSETFRLFTVFHRLETIKLVVRVGYTVLLATIALGVIGALLSWLWVGIRQWTLIGGVVLVVLQLASIGFLYWASCRLETYEDIT